jgi:hypothetical protein
MDLDFNFQKNKYKNNPHPLSQPYMHRPEHQKGGDHNGIYGVAHRYTTVVMMMMKMMMTTTMIF